MVLLVNEIALPPPEYSIPRSCVICNDRWLSTTTTTGNNILLRVDGWVGGYTRVTISIYDASSSSSTIRPTPPRGAPRPRPAAARKRCDQLPSWPKAARPFVVVGAPTVRPSVRPSILAADPGAQKLGGGSTGSGVVGRWSSARRKRHDPSRRSIPPTAAPGYDRVFRPGVL